MYKPPFKLHDKLPDLSESNCHIVGGYHNVRCELIYLLGLIARIDSNETGH